MVAEPVYVERWIAREEWLAYKADGWELCPTWTGNGLRVRKPSGVAYFYVAVQP